MKDLIFYKITLFAVLKNFYYDPYCITDINLCTLNIEMYITLKIFAFSVQETF